MKALGVPMPLDHTATMRGPILGLFGGADPGIPVEQVELLDQRLDEAGVEHDIHVYPGAPHSFFDRSFEEHAEACDDAWRRVLGFLPPRACRPDGLGQTPAVLRLAQRRHRAGDVQVLGRDRPRVEVLLAPGVLDLRTRRLAEVAGPAAPAHLAEVDERRGLRRGTRSGPSRRSRSR